MPGCDSSKAVDSSCDTPTSLINFNMVLMPVSQSFPRHSPLPTNHPSLSTLPNSTTSYSLSLKSNVMLAPSQSPKLRPSLDPSKPLHSALYQNLDNQANFKSSKTCHPTCTSQWHLIYQQLHQLRPLSNYLGFLLHYLHPHLAAATRIINCPMRCHGSVLHNTTCSITMAWNGCLLA